MRPQELERIIRQSLDEAHTDKELLVFRKLLQGIDKDVEIKIASTSMDPELLYDLALRVGPGYMEARTIAEKRLEDLSPKKHRDLESTNYLTRCMILPDR